jgi:hypothetical protein
MGPYLRAEGHYGDYTTAVDCVKRLRYGNVPGGERFPAQSKDNTSGLFTNFLDMRCKSELMVDVSP